MDIDWWYLPTGISSTKLKFLLRHQGRTCIIIRFRILKAEHSLQKAWIKDFRHACLTTHYKSQRCINIWFKSASLSLYQAIKKRSPFADPIYTILNSTFMQCWVNSILLKRDIWKKLPLNYRSVGIYLQKEHNTNFKKRVERPLTLVQGRGAGRKKLLL